MLFNSYEFIFLFLPITLIVYFLLSKKNSKLSKLWLVLASLYFYSYFNKIYLLLILGSIGINYTIGSSLSKTNDYIKRKILLVLGVLLNLGALGYFKYYDFFIENINVIFKTNFNLLHILLPLGISFFTFQQVSYVVDSYRQKSLQYDFLSYCLFVTFFPQLIAGPIVLPAEMLPQFEDENNKTVNWENINKGMYIFSIGLAKKVIIADTIARFANAGFDMMDSLNFAEAWLTSISYTLQLYFDFSGYCDMAIGIGLMFNILLPFNFNSPYKACDFQEFWRKWHITLGRFMTNYLYIPLGGNRKGELRTLRNLLLVFLLSGIWHGAGWNFIIWGLLHGLCILIHRVWKNIGMKLPKLLGWFITINLVNIFWIFFRAKTLKGAMKVISGMFDLNGFIYLVKHPTNIFDFASNLLNKSAEMLGGLGNKETILFFGLGILIVFLAKNSLELLHKFKPKLIYNFEISFYMLISIFSLTGISTFLYFNF